MSMCICPDCLGTGSNIEYRLPGTSGGRTWCRTCHGSGLIQKPDQDDEHEPPELFWPESIRWRRSA